MGYVIDTVTILKISMMDSTVPIKSTNAIPAMNKYAHPALPMASVTQDVITPNAVGTEEIVSIHL